MASKRSSPDDDDFERSNTPIGKRVNRVTFEPVKLPAVSTVSELEKHVLTFQYRKLRESLVKKDRQAEDLRRRIEQLEKRQTQDDAMNCIINRHWNRLDEDVRILLQRFDAETSVEVEAENEAKATTSFLNELSQWDKSEVNNRLSQRVEFSRRAIGKLVQAFDRITQRNESITERLKELKGGDDAEGVRPESDQGIDKALLDEAVVSLNAELQEENKRLQSQAIELHKKSRILDNENAKMKEKLNASETRVEEMQNKCEEMEYELETSKNYAYKLEFNLSELKKQMEENELKLTSLQAEVAEKPNSQKDAENEFSKVSKSKLEEYQTELCDQRELANSRLSELRELADRHKETLQEVEKLRSDLHSLPDEIIVESMVYKRLESQFGLLYEEVLHLRGLYEQARQYLIEAKTAHLKQIEQMESEELVAQKQLRSEMVILEDQTSQVRKEYEMLRLEFEQNLAANEQSGPVNKEMRQLVGSLKNQNHQLKIELNKCKKKAKESFALITKLQKDADEMRKFYSRAVVLPPKAKEEEVQRPSSIPSAAAVPESEKAVKAEAASEDCTASVKEEAVPESEDCASGEADAELAQIRNLKAQIAALDKEAERAATSSGDANNKLQKLTIDNVRMRDQLKQLNAIELSARKQLVDEDTSRQIKQLEDQVEQLKREVANCKQEEGALLNEMEVTGQAFEDMQEQNMRLVQQLREKDDANFKLMSERIRSNQQFKLVREEKGLVEQQVVALQNQVEAQNLVVRKLEDKERLLQNNLATVEKELHLRQQSLDVYKRKSAEAAQSSVDLKLQLEKLQAQLNEASSVVQEKTAALEEDNFRINRFQEEISTLKKKIERIKKIEAAGTQDAVLEEENRQLKKELTCPSCKVNRKDAVISKCFHVFCMNCLKTRYETRQRKCPKCNAAFGANDYRRIYFS